MFLYFFSSFETKGENYFMRFSFHRSVFIFLIMLSPVFLWAQTVKEDFTSIAFNDQYRLVRLRLGADARSVARDFEFCVFAVAHHDVNHSALVAPDS